MKKGIIYSNQAVIFGKPDIIGYSNGKMCIKEIDRVVQECYDNYYDISKDEFNNSEYIFNKVIMLLKCKSMPVYKQKISYIKGILKNKMTYLNENKFYSMFRNISNDENVGLLNYITEEIKKVDKINNYTMFDIFNDIVNEYISQNNGK